MSQMSELDMELETIRRVMADEPEPHEVAPAMAVRDLMSATKSLSELASCKSTERLVRVEANDIELAYTRLGRMLSRIRMEKPHAA